MNVVKHIICELTGYRPGTVDVSQGDRGSRAVRCRLLENGAPWMIPEGAAVRVAYTLPDGTEGLYDALPDGSPAGEIAGNTVTVALADQIMDQAGMAQVSILVLGPEGGQLATWPIRVMVMANKAARLTVPENLPPYGAGFSGKLFYGGADGTITPLGLGDGVRVEMMANGEMVLVGEGSGPSEDILTELRALANRVNAALNSDDATLDQLSEIVAYIKSNKTLIDAITTSKVSVADIIDNLTTNVANKPLSAAQGVVLKTLIDELRQTVGQGGGTGDGAVRSVNGKTGDVTLTATDVGAMSESGANAIIINLLDEAKKSGEFDGAPGPAGADGQPGKDGVSVTHSWNGTVLSVTSASGTSSADLKGEPGKDGNPGADGKTPVKGEDYFTPAEIEEIAEQAAGMVEVPKPNLSGYATEEYVDQSVSGLVPDTRTINGFLLKSNITLNAKNVKALPEDTPIPSIDGLASEEYVDNAVKGNKWELIETITLTEDVKTIERSVEPDGTPYNFIKMGVKSAMAPGSVGSAAVNYKFNNSMRLVLSGTVHIDIKKTHSIVYATTENGGFDGYTSWGSSNGEYVTMNLQSVSHYRFLMPCDKFTSINLSSPTTAVFPTGSVIEIWGVRA